MPEHPGPGAAGNVLDGTSWRAVEGIDHLDVVAVTAEFDATAVAGTGGCNRYRATYAIDRDRFGLTGPVMGTLMACPEPQMAVEAAFVDRLSRARSFRLDDGRLTLFDAIGTPVVVLRRLGPDDLLGEWVVTSMHIPAREAVVSVDGGLTVTFSPGEVHGDAGCNTFRGRWKIDGQQLGIGPLATTRKLCPEPAMTTERALLAALGSVAGWRLSGAHLELLRADGGIAVTLQRPTPA